MLKTPISPLPTGFYGNTWGVLCAHAEDSSSPTFIEWTDANFLAFLDTGVPLVTWLHEKGIPAHFGPTPDFINAVMRAPTDKTEGKNFIQWSRALGVSWDARAHKGGLYNAADTELALEGAGAPFSGILSSYEDAAEYSGTIVGTQQRNAIHFNTLMGYGESGHTETTFLAGLKSQGDQAIILGGRSSSFAHATAVSRGVLSGTLRAGVVTPMFALGARRDGKASYCSVAYSSSKAGSGVPVRTAMEHSMSDSPLVKWVSAPTLVAAWRAAGGADYTYDAATIGSGGAIVAQH